MKFAYTNGVFDTDNIQPHELRMFNQVMQHIYKLIESIVNPRRCIKLDVKIIQQRAVLLSDRISSELGLTQEQTTYVIEYVATKKGHPPG